MIYKVGLLGATGRMGQEIASLMTQGFETRGDVLEFCDAIAGSKKISSIDGVPVRQMQDPDFDPAHVWIDFSIPQATMAFLEVATTALVIGTTGFTESEVKKIEAYAEKKPVLLAPNMSPGMSYMMRMLKSVPVCSDTGFSDVLLSETHHLKKKDSPSGTARALLSILHENGNKNVQVQVVRAGGVKGEHTIRFISEDEQLILEHRVMDLKVFAKGALLAAHFIVKQKPGLYSMHDLEVK